MPEQPARIVVIGGGLAGAKTVEALREQGYEGSLDLVADEADLPYERPPLSKDYLQGKARVREGGRARRASGTPTTTSTCAAATAAMSIDRDAHEVDAGRRHRDPRLRQARARHRRGPPQARRARRRWPLNTCAPTTTPTCSRRHSAGRRRSSSSVPAGSVSRSPRPRAAPART